MFMYTDWYTVGGHQRKLNDIYMPIQTISEGLEINKKMI